MPNPRNLTILTDLRRACGVSLEQMAGRCGLTGTRSRESVAAWERGQSVPRKRFRPKFIDYLGDTLGLRHEPARFDEVWDVLVHEWDWDELGEDEWSQHFPDVAVPPSSRPAVVHAVDPTTLAEAQATLARMPTCGSVPPPAPLPAGSRMPLHCNRIFAGREPELLAIARALTNDGAVAVHQVETAATTGLGGIGKTQLACEFVHRYGQYFAGGVFWLSFADAAGIPSEVAACGDHGHLALRPDFGELTLKNQVELVLAAWRNPLPRLLVFDNCEDEELLAGWRPTTGGCAVIVTSQRSLWDPTLGVRAISLDVLDRATSIALLRKYLSGIDAQTSDLDAIAEEVGDLPLALHMAGSYLARSDDGITPADYLAQLRKSNPLLHPSLQGAAFSPTGHAQHVGRTFALSLARLNPDDPTDRLARAVLARAAHLAPGELIPRDLLLAVCEVQEDGVRQRIVFDDALQRLVALGFLELAEQGAFRLHRLVVRFVLGALSDRQAQADVERVVLSTAEQLAEAYDYTAILHLQPQLHFVTERALLRADEPAAALATTLGHHLWILSDFVSAQDYLERALAIRAQAPDADPLKIAATLNILGLALQIQVKLDTALRHTQRALAIWEAHLGPEHPSTDAEVNNIGYLHLLRGEYAAAETAFRRSLKTRHRLYGVRNRETARVLHNIGLLSVKRGAYRVARRYLQLALAIREQLLPPAHAATAITLNHLGEVFYWLGDYPRALAYHRRALAMRQQVFGEMHVAIAESLTNLGRLLHAQGDTAQAHAYQQQALAMHEALGTAKGYDAAFTWDELGALLCKAGEYDKAQTHLEQALVIWEHGFGWWHPERVSPLNHLAHVLRAKGNLPGAQTCLEQALEICREKLGAQHPWTAATLRALGDIHRQAGNDDAARGA